jgi:heme/copper-type cytochrome/quinol oxidase subunit 3
MIPYTVERRPDTGVTSVVMGVWLFLASEVMLFGALFSAYALLRVSSPDWPSGREVLGVGFGAAHTAVLLGATAAVWRARAAGPGRAAGLLWTACALALVFLATKGVEYSGEVAAGLVPSANTFLATYFTLTGLHAIHVAAGLAANVWVIAGARRIPAALTAGRLQALSLYWLFVDVVWIAILIAMYLS